MTSLSDMVTQISFLPAATAPRRRIDDMNFWWNLTDNMQRWHREAEKWEKIHELFVLHFSACFTYSKSCWNTCDPCNQFSTSIHEIADKHSTAFRESICLCTSLRSFGTTRCWNIVREPISWSTMSTALQCTLNILNSLNILPIIWIRHRLIPERAKTVFSNHSQVFGVHECVYCDDDLSHDEYEQEECVLRSLIKQKSFVNNETKRGNKSKRKQVRWTHHIYHALTLSYRTTASKEWDEKDDATEHQHNDGHNFGIVFRKSFTQILELEQWQRTNDNQGNSKKL